MGGERLVLKAQLKAFIEDITVSSEIEAAFRIVSNRLDDLITLSRMKFKAKKSRKAKRKKYSSLYLETQCQQSKKAL